MGINTNTPTLSYIQWKDLLITHNDIIYQIQNSYTNKPYIYWNINDPYKLITSNTLLKEEAGVYYIFFNQNGVYTQVPQSEIQVSFSNEGSKDLITQQIIAFGEQQKINNEKFSTLEIDIDGIKTSVGEVKEDINGTKQTISEIDQKADSISLNISTLEREFEENEELRELRDNVNNALLKLQSSLGLFNSDINVYMEDNKLSNEERNNINAYKEIITDAKEELETQIDEVIKFLTSNERTEDIKTLTAQKNSLNEAFSNLFTNINTSISDDIFTNTEMATIITYFSKANTEINEMNTMIDDLIFLGSSGEIVKKISEMTINQDEIKLGLKQEISNIKKDIDDDIETIEKRVTTAEQKITKDAISSVVKDSFYTKEEIDSQINEIEQQTDNTVINVKTQYYLSSSKTSLIGGSWLDVAPEWSKDKYMWSRTVTTFKNGNITNGNPICITGADGQSYYTWIRYADDMYGNGISNDPTNKSYIGFAYNRTSQTESNVASDYIWSKMKGEDGLNGKDGTSVTILGTYNSVNELNQAHPSGNKNGDGYIVGKDLYVWDGNEFLNVGQIKGADGVDGKNGATPYVHIKYSNDNGQTFTPNNGEDSGDYMGIYTDYIISDSTNTNDYKWSKLKGQDGVPGEKGKDGKTYYTWIKYSDNSDGSNLYDTPNSETKYIGIAYNKTTSIESTNKSDYIWSKMKGEDGVPGADGRGIVSVTPQYYLSTSKTGQVGGSWTENSPTWQKGKYLWVRHKIVYENPSSTGYTTAVLDSDWQGLIDLQGQIDKNKIEIETTKKTIADHTVSLDNITSKVSTIETKTTKMEGQITSQETRIKTAEEKITDDAIINTVSKTYASKTELNNLQVGGKNLISNSAPISTADWAYGTGWGISLVDCDKAPNAKAVRVTANTAGVSGGMHKQPIDYTKFVNGANYIISAWIRASKQIRINFRQETMDVNNYVTVTTEWKYYTFTHSINTSAQYHSNVFYVSSDSNIAVGDWFEVHSLKLEKGNKATDWTPAPEDIDDKIYNVESKIQQTSDAWTATFKESGGYNRVYNSAFLTGDLTHWSSWGTCEKAVENSTTSGLSKCLKITTTNTNQGVQQVITGLKQGSKYTLSALVYAISGVGTIQVNNNGSYPSKSTTTTGVFEKLSITFVAATTQVTVQLGRGGRGGGGAYYYTGVLLTEGDMDIPWSPHPSEVYDGITTIDKNGVKVSQSNYNGYTRMSADGFYVNDGKTDAVKITKDGAVFTGKMVIQSGSSVPTSTLSGNISSSQLNSTITNDISTAKSNASTALSTANTAKSTADTAKSTATTASTNATNAVNTANTANTNANTAKTNAATALSTANTAKSTADSVNTTINNGKTNWDNAYNRVNQWAYGAVTGNTTIDGAYIQTNTIAAEKIALGDFTNYAELNADTLSKWGWTSVADMSAKSNPWFQKSSISRDNQISKYYTCNGGESLRVKADIFTSVYGQTTQGGTATATARPVGIMIFTINANGTREYICNGRVTATSTSGKTGTVNNVVTLPTTARQFAVYVQIEGYPTFSGVLRVRNVQVTKMSSGELIVDGAITAGKISSGAITTEKLAANAVTAAKIAAGTITADKIATGAITANMITTGTLSGDLINGGTIKGATLQTYANSTSKGVVINKESMYLNGTKFLYKTSDNFRIASDQTLTLSSPKDIYLLAGLSTNESQTGTNNVIIPSATLRTQKLLVINDTTIQGACAVSKAFSCASVSCVGSIAATNGFSSSNGGLVVTGSITTNSGNINATAGQVKSKTLSVTSSSTLSGNVSCGGNLTASSGTITAKTLKSTGAINCASFASTGDASFGNNVWIKYLYVNGTWVSSDKRKKMDIRYVDKDEQTIAESGLIAPNVNINKNDMHEFIEALPIASYRYIDDVENKKDVTHYGLVVQDVLYTKVGSELVKVLDDEKQIGDEDDYMGYSQEKLLTFMCGALQKEIELRKELEKRIEELENKSNK